MDISVLYKIPKDSVIWESDEQSEIDEQYEIDDDTLDSTVEHVYIMNRIEDIAEWFSVTQSIKMSNVGLEYYTRFPKKNHKKNSLIEQWQNSKDNCSTIKEYALTKTVLDIINDAKIKEYSKILILNDSSRFHGNAKQLFKTQIKKINSINPQWKIIHLAAEQLNYNTTSDKNYYYPSIYTKQVFAFMIDQTIYDNIINKLTSGKNINDIFMEYNKNKDAFVLYPNVVCTNNNYNQYGKDIEGYTIITRPKNSPLISVIMTAHNADRYIRYSIESILSQTYTNIELIIINDASKDKTSKIIEEYANRDNRITYICNNTNYGTYVSKNIGIKHSKGQYITFQDADDYSIRNRLELQLNSLKNSNNLVCYGKYISKQAKLQFCEITLFMRKDCVDYIGYFDSVRFGADTEYRRRLEILKIPIIVIDKYIYTRLDRLIEGNNIGNLNSLTNSKRTGMDSKLRLIYRKSFECYHSIIRTRNGMNKKAYYMPFPLDKRPFNILVADSFELGNIAVELDSLDKYIYKVKL